MLPAKINFCDNDRRGWVRRSLTRSGGSSSTPSTVTMAVVVVPPSCGGGLGWNLKAALYSDSLAPVVWLMTKQAFRPRAIKHSYSAENWAAATVEPGEGILLHACTRVTSGHARPRGGHRKIWGRGEGLDSWHPAGLARSPVTPRRGGGVAWGKNG